MRKLKLYDSFKEGEINICRGIGFVSYASIDTDQKFLSLLQNFYDADKELRGFLDRHPEAEKRIDGLSSLLFGWIERIYLSYKKPVPEGESRTAVLDALPAHVAILDPLGQISWTNRAWQEFGRSNGLGDEGAGIGCNYIGECERAALGGDDVSALAGDGIRRVLSGELNEFNLEYPCHSPSENRWFHLMVLPWTDAGSLGAVVLHISIARQKLAEQALHVSLKELADLKAALDEHAIVAITDPAGRILYVNEHFCRVSQYQTHELIGQNHRIVNSGHHPSSFFKAMWQSIASGQGWKGEICNRAKDGSLYWVDTTIVPFLDGQGRPYQYVAIRTDITRRKRMEEMLHHQEQIRYRQLFDDNPMPMVVYDQDSFKFLAVNDAALALYGYRRDAFLSLGVVDVIAGRVDEGLIAKFRHGGPVLNHTSAVQQRTRDGRLIETETYSHTLMFSGSRARMVMVLDVTERLRMMDAVRHSEGRLRAVIEHSPNCVAIVSADGIIIDINPAGLHFAEAEGPSEVIGHPFIRFVQPEDHDLALAVHEATLNGHSGTTSFRAVGLKGAQRWLETSVVPLRLRESNEVSVLSVTQDVTERVAATNELERLNAELEDRVRQRTAQLEEVNRQLESFSYTVSHDLRLPLSGVNGFCYLLEKEISAQVSERGRHLMSRIRASAVQMSDMIEGLLQLSQLGRVTPQFSVVDLGEMANQILEGLAASAPQRKVEITVQPELLAFGDGRLLMQVLSNLLGNAWKFTSLREIARISVGSEVDQDGRVIFFVRDNGAGFDMGKADKLFSAFQRLHSTSDFAGSGIGLATVHRIIERHQGHVWACSEVNEGAVFFFRLGDLKGTDEMQLD